LGHKRPVLNRVNNRRRITEKHDKYFSSLFIPCRYRDF
jgi:hypothetical protein